MQEEPIDSETTLESEPQPSVESLPIPSASEVES